MSSSGRRALLAGLLDFEVLQTLSSSLFSSLLPSTDSDRRPFLSAAADVKRTAADGDGRTDAQIAQLAFLSPTLTVSPTMSPVS